MQQELRIRIKVDKQTGELSAIDGEFNKLTDSTKKADKNTKQLKTSTDGLSGAFSRLKGIVSAYIGIQTAKEYVKTTDSMKLLESRVNLVAGATDNYVDIQKELLKTANDNRTQLNAVGNLYVKLKDPITKLGGYTQTAMDITDSFSKTLLLSGANTQEAASATLQFAQAMASGVLRGDEFRSISEASPKVLKVLSAELNVSAGQLRKMSEEGKLTAGVVGGALLSSLGGLENGVKSIKPTVSGALQVFSNELGIVVEKFDKATGANDALIQGITALTEILKNSPQYFENVNSSWDKFYNTAEKLNTIKINNDSFLGLLKSGNTNISVDDSLVQSAAKVYNMTGQAMYGVLAETWGVVDKSAGEWAKIIESGNRGIVGWMDDIAKVSTEYDKVAKKIDEINTKEISVPLRPTDEKTQLDFSAFKKEEMRQRSIDTLKFNSEQEAARQKAEDDAKIAQEKALKESEQLEKSWSEKKLDLVKDLSIAESDALAKPYIELQSKYEEDLAKYASIAGAKEQLTKTFQANIEKLNKETVKEFNEKELKDFEESFKNRQEVYKTYYTSLDNVQELFYIEESEKLEKLAKAGVLSNEQMLTVWAKDNEKFRDEQFKKNNEWLYDFFDNVNKALDEQLLGGMKGKFSSFGDWMKSTFNAIGDSMLAGFSRSLAGSVTGSLQSSILNSMRSTYSTGLSALGDGSTVSASEISTLMNAGGTFDSATNSITTAGGTAIKLSENGTGTVEKGGSDILSLANTVSSLKTAYSVLTGGISSSLMSGFNGVSDVLASQGYWSAANGVSNFGYGFANPLSNYSVGSGAFGSTMAGGMLSSGLLGYGMGSLGDMIFGADTKAGIGGAAGAAIGSIIPGVGTIVGGLIGSALGGLFGSKKITDTGYNFLSDATSNNIDVMGYSNWKKKSWFSSSKGSTPAELSATQKREIEGVFKTYDYLLLQLGDMDKILLEAGKYSGETFKDEVSKKFITAFTDIPRTITQELTKTIEDWDVDGWYGDIITTTTTKTLDNAKFTEIYDAWVNYAKSIDKSVMEALSQSVASFIKSKRDFEVWSLGDSVAALAKKAQFAQEDFSNLENIIGTTGITVDNYLTMYNNAIKNNFTAETITQWDSLGDALISATDAQTAYQEALKAQEDVLKQANEAIRQSALSALGSELTAWISALGSVQNSINAISGTLTSFKDLESSALTLDNYTTLLSELEATRQNEISALQKTYNTRITQLANEKTLFNSLANYIDDLNLKLLGSNITSDYFFDELGKAKATLLAGGTVDASKLTSSASSYLDSALQNSTSQLEYFREVAKVKAGISDLGSSLTGGSLEGIEAAIASEEATLAFKLDLLNQTALGILNGWKSTATTTISTTTDKYNALNEDVVAKAYSEVLGRTAEKEGYAYWTEQITKGNITALNIKEAIANAALAYDTSKQNISGVADATITQSIENARKWINGSHAGGIRSIPFDGYIAELHRGERVQTEREARKDDATIALTQKIEDLTQVFISQKAHDIRLRQLFERLSPDGDALQTRSIA